MISIRLNELRRYFFVRDGVDVDGEIRRRVYRASDGALSHRDAARVLVDAKMQANALLLYREAVMALAAASGPLAAAAGKDEERTESLDEALLALGASLEGKGLSSRFAQLSSRIRPFRVDEIGALPRRELNQLCEAFDELTDWLLAQSELRTPKQTRAERVKRFAGAAFLVFVAPWIYYSWENFPRLVSGGQPVTASSEGSSVPVQIVTDKLNYNHPVFRTEREVGPWVEIDLGSSFVITDIEVFGPHHCCFDDGVPVVAETSRDGTNYELAGRRTEPFVSLEPWRVTGVKGTGRYVRLRSEGNKTLHLAEISVFGRPAK